MVRTEAGLVSLPCSSSHAVTISAFKGYKHVGVCFTWKETPTLSGWFCGEIVGERVSYETWLVFISTYNKGVAELV